MSLVLLSLVLPSLRVTPGKISLSGLVYVTGATVTGVSFLVGNTSEDWYIRSYVQYVTGVTVTGVTFLTGNTSEDQFIRSCVCYWCYCHWCYLPYG